MSKDTGGPAFPIFPETGGGHAAAFHGMTLRDYLAAKSLQGLLANPKLQPEILKQGGARSGWIEESAYAFADAMLEVRK